jgi:hypothetical protein
VDVWCLVASGAAIVVAAFLPWASVTAPFLGSVNKTGINIGIDGIVTALIGLMLVGSGIARMQPTWSGRTRVLAVVGAAVILAIALYDLSDIQSRVDKVTASTKLVTASVGAGLYLTLAAAIVALIAAIKTARRETS